MSKTRSWHVAWLSKASRVPLRTHSNPRQLLADSKSNSIRPNPSTKVAK